MKTSVMLSVALASCLLAACQTEQRGRIMSDTEEDFVGNQAAGAATFDQLVSGATDRLLKLHSAAKTGMTKLTVCVLPVENASSEELGDWQEQIYELMTTSINRSERYTMLRRRFVDGALRETRLRPDELFLPAKRRQFIAVLEAQGNPVDAMIFPKLTSGTTGASQGTTQRNYMLTMELVDVETGKSEQVAERLRKQYSK